MTGQRLSLLKKCIAARDGSKSMPSSGINQYTEVFLGLVSPKYLGINPQAKSEKS
jgi:hypothetical protein